LDLIGDAAAFVALVGFGDDVEAGLRVLRFEELRIGPPAGNSRNVRDQQNFAGIAAPEQFVAANAPVVGDFADGGEDFGGIKMRGGVPRGSGGNGLAGARGRE
jgi:hypothetical protein